MPGEPAPTPTAVPDAPKGRLEQALELVTEEAIRVLDEGRDPRAFQRTEKLLAIARAIRLECGTRVEDVMTTGQKRGGAIQGNVLWNAEPAYNIVGGPDMPEIHIGGQQNATGDFRREEKLAQIEAVAARKRKDDAQARLSMVQELDQLTKLDTSKLSEDVKAGLDARMLEITKALTGVVSTPEEPEAT